MALKVAVTGASGFIGGHLCRTLKEAGHNVVPVVRSGAIVPPFGVVIDRLDGKTDWSLALHEVDVVIHTAARVHVLHDTADDSAQAYKTVNVKATERLARQAAQAGVKRMIFLSTIGVLGNYNRTPFSEADEPNPSNSYSQSKWEAEQALMKVAKETGLEVTIVRPPLVYGPGVKANFLKLMEAVHEGAHLPFRMVKNQRDFVSIGNLCDFIEKAMQHPAAINQTYLICDEEAVSTPALIRALAKQMDIKTCMTFVPHWMLFVGAKLLGKGRFYHSVCSSLRIYTHKAHDDLKWEPKETLEEGLKQTVEWFLEQRGEAA